MLPEKFRMQMYLPEQVNQKPGIYADFRQPPSPSITPSDIIKDKVDSFCNERSRGQALALMGPTRPSNESEGINDGERYVGSTPWKCSLLISEITRSSDPLTQGRSLITGSELGGRPMSLLQSCGRQNISNIVQDEEGEGEENSYPSGLAHSPMVRNGTPHRSNVTSPASPRFSGVDGGSIRPELLYAPVN